MSLILTAECITKNERKGNGNVLFAVDVATQNVDGKPQATARKVLNYQTSDPVELDGFKVGKNYSIAITPLDLS